MNRDYLRILRLLLRQPTAPFHEQGVAAAVKDWAGSRGLGVRHDRAGNLLVRYGRGRGPLWVLAAHMDHPAFIVRQSSGNEVLADFRGSVAASYFHGGRVRFFSPAGEATAAVESAAPIPRTPWFSCRLRLDVPADLPPGTIGMWDLPPCEVRENRLVSRGCDDVVGVASVLCALDELVRRKASGQVIGLLTRAEEAGFIGTLAACRARSIPRRGLIVSIEASQAQPLAPLASGVVVRVGDKLRTFDPALTAHVSAVAERLSAGRGAFRHTRMLMPGGTCEATPFMLSGYAATGVCVPLANYHNMGEDGRIRAEEIDLGDFACLVRLLVELVCGPDSPSDSDRRLKARLADMLRQRGPLLGPRGFRPRASPHAYWRRRRRNQAD